jgi:hypothetical protein
MRYKLCAECGQPIKPGRHKTDEYRHASGCQSDRSKYREVPVEILISGKMRRMSRGQVRAWRKRIATKVSKS